jgi:F-type H+-transporting ATPase subunit delta
MEEIARVYAEALFGVAKKAGKLDEIRDELAEFTRALEENRDLAVFFFSPYFSSAEKRDGIERTVSGASPEFVNFLELLVEKHRMPVIFRVRRRYEDLWAEENKLLDVTVTSAVELDPEIVERVGKEIEKQTGRTVELTSEVDEGILGGLVLRVGDMVLDASVRNRLERLRKNIAAAA